MNLKRFQSRKIFAPMPGSNVIEVTFFIPGTNIPATVSGFGAVFCDADTPATHMQFYDQNGRILLQRRAIPSSARTKAWHFRASRFMTVPGSRAS